MTRKMFWRIVIMLTIGLPTALLIALERGDRTIIDENVRANPQLLAAAQRHIQTRAGTYKSARFCAVVSPARVKYLQRIAPDCDFVRLSFKRRWWHLWFVNSSSAAVWPETIAVRRRDGQYRTGLGPIYSLTAFPEFLIWAQVKLRSSRDAEDICLAVSESQETPNRPEVNEEPRRHTRSGNFWLIDSQAPQSDQALFRLEVNSSATIVGGEFYLME